MPQLAALVREKHPGAYDDLSDAELEAAVRAKYPGVYDDLAEPEAPEHPHARVARLVGENLPAIGGAIGGVLGAVGGPLVAAGTAGLGGAAGRLAQRAIGAEGVDVADVAKEGAVQGGIQAVGGAAGKMLGGMGRRLYQGLAKPSKALRAEFPDAVPTALNARVPLTQGGSSKAERLVSGSHDEAERVIANRQAHGATITKREMTSELGDVTKQLQLRARTGQPSELDAVARQVTGIYRRNPTLIPIAEAQQLKRAAQEASQGAYKARDMGAKTQLSGDDLAQEAVAKGTRKAIERRAPEVADLNRRTQSLMGADRMVSDAVGREGNNLMVGRMGDLISVGAGAGLGSLGGSPEGGAGLGLLVRLLSTPSTGSRAAILMNEASRTQAVQNALRALMVGQE